VFAEAGGILWLASLTKEDEYGKRPQLVYELVQLVAGVGALSVPRSCRTSASHRLFRLLPGKSGKNPALSESVRGAAWEYPVSSSRIGVTTRGLVREGSSMRV
jgi:hypothetical protein